MELAAGDHRPVEHIVPEALLRLAGAVLVEAHDEWQATDRRCLGEATMDLLNSPTPETVATP